MSMSTKTEDLINYVEHGLRLKRHLDWKPTCFVKKKLRLQRLEKSVRVGDSSLATANDVLRMGGVPEHNPRFAWGLGPVSKQPCWEVCFLALKMPWETLGLGKGPDIFCLGGRTIHDFFVCILPHLFWVMKNNKIRVGLVGIEGLWIGYGESILYILVTYTGKYNIIRKA